MQRATLALVSVDALVDALVAHAGLFVDQKVAADLLWTPHLFEFGFNQLPGFDFNPRPVCAGLLASLCK